MKNIYKFMACALALTGALSCSKLNETPVFEDSKSFVALGSTSYIVNEDCGTLSIPVTMASPTTKQAAVAYTVNDGTAKLGTNFTLADEAAVLVFDGETYTQNIVINIVNIATTAEQSGYTGDLTFTVTLASAGDLELGFNKTCTVKIMDLDHPLASILGTYDVTGTFYGGNAASWVMTMEKDENDPTVVWIDTPSYFAVAAASWGAYQRISRLSLSLADSHVLLIRLHQLGVMTRAIHSSSVLGLQVLSLSTLAWLHSLSRQMVHGQQRMLQQFGQRYLILFTPRCSWMQVQ